ncbi:bifunctional phosphopantothenoylcysteine decarboxylase/phosphopantothenate--cysteine ligase CoaBC [Geomesophilobacter sediminis]|uniref:Coenzyme A biosynthesis bifunctional protein CoaBC n=1 Tax=Geomesophilobacter sediminis TaxID=2798584 RepID=A0A8J7JAA4_9BACT|nr:bifunctional phosphopantothenoylcysteine decarboxylase/phosphopantothenate--cysteine ligase CoaBC [Geomesophilobacter sediminis]MBJ6723218.1 bifunctional phosphopantothenoylcysteine decarboxylase/phosphopantothenate--cysteine ligase CoaBC [Geomesophilobacter sediminis]
MLTGKTIVLGVTGGIAVYKAVELLRLLTKAGATVHVVMTKAATEFVTPLTFQTLSGNPVHTELFNLISEQEIGHISLADRADLFIIAPATANFVGKVACGLADDLLSTTVMATKAPVLFSPAMNVNMYQNPLYKENEERLKRHGYLFVPAVKGMLACGWEGEGKLPAPEVIFEEAVAALTPKSMAGRRVLITAGPTREEIDPIRYISNYSSGKMGYAIAREARLRGAQVTLVTGPTALTLPCGIDVVPVNSAEEMRRAVLERLERTDVVIKAAAVADYRPKVRAAAKVKKGASELVLELEKNPDILAEVGAMKGDRVVVGFAAETHDLIANATKKLTGKNVDMIVANDVSQEGAGFNVDTNIAKLLLRDGTVEELPKMGKDELAGVILDRITTLAEAKGRAK